MSKIRRKVKKPLFWKVLAGYALLTLLVLALTGSVFLMLTRVYVLKSNLKDLTNKSGIVSQMLSRPDGRIRFLTLRGLFELENLCDAQILYVDSDMVARRMSTRRSRGIWNGESVSKKTNRASETDDGKPIKQPRRQDSDESIPPISDVLKLLNRLEFSDYPDLSAFAADGDSAMDKNGDGQIDISDNTPLERVDLSGTLDEELIRSIMSGGIATDVRRIHFLNSLVMFAGMPITDVESGRVVAAIVLCRPVDEVRVITGSMIRLIAYSGVAALFCAALVAFFMSRVITRPIESMSLIAQRMSEGHYGERCAIKTDGELGRLGDTLDTLSQRLSDVIGNLSAEKSKLEKIISAIGEGLIAIDPSGGIVHHNAAALNLLDIKNWDEKSSNPDIMRIKDELSDMLMKSVETGSNLTTSWKTISGRAIEATASPVVDDEGTTFGAVCLIKDVTEAQKAEQMRRDFIANVSHELRTPLTGIRGMVEPLMDGLMQTEKERADCYNVIYQETIRLEKLIREMLDLSRLQSGRAVIELEPMPYGDLVEAVRRRMEDHAKASKVTLTTDVDDGSALVLGNDDRIIQVMIILCDNALSFTPAGGTVTLFARTLSDAVEIGVTDTGCGVDPVDLPYIWERFYKADRSRMRTSGTGLGLAIAKMVVELMGGTIDVKTRVGNGSTFYFTLKKA